MITREYRSETGVRDHAAAAGKGILRSIAGAYGRWVTRRQVIRQLYRPDQRANMDLAIDSSEFNSIVFGDVAARKRPNAKH